MFQDTQDRYFHNFQMPLNPYVHLIIKRNFLKGKNQVKCLCDRLKNEGNALQLLPSREVESVFPPVESPTAGGRSDDVWVLRPGLKGSCWGCSQAPGTPSLLCEQAQAGLLADDRHRACSPGPQPTSHQLPDAEPPCWQQMTQHVSEPSWSQHTPSWVHPNRRLTELQPK